MADALPEFNPPNEIANPTTRGRYCLLHRAAWTPTPLDLVALPEASPPVSAGRSASTDQSGDVYVDIEHRFDSEMSHERE
jgi:hypothetical protein